MLNIAARFLSEAVTRGGALILFPLLARHLGSEGYGVYAQANAVNGVLLPIATLGLGFSVVRLVSGAVDREFVSSRFISSILLVVSVSVLLALAIYVAAPSINDAFIKTPAATSVLRWSALIVISTSMNLTVAEYFRARLKIVVYSVSQVATTILTVAGSALVLTQGGGLVEVIKVMLVLQFAQLLVTTAYLKLAGEIDLRGRLMSREELVLMVRFGIPVVITGLGTWVFASSDRLLIGMYLSASDAGVYHAAYSLAGVPTALAGPFWYAIFPLMATHTKNGDREKVSALCRRYSSAYFLVGVPALAGLSVLAADTLQILGSGGFSSPPLLFTVIALGLFSDQVAGTSHYLIYLHNEPAFLRDTTAIAGALNIVLNILLLPVIGIMGAALSTLAAYLLFETLVVRRALSYGYSLASLYNFKSIALISISTVAMVVVLLATRMGYPTTDLRALVVVSLWGVVVYTLALLACLRFDAKRLVAFARTGTP